MRSTCALVALVVLLAMLYAPSTARNWCPRSDNLLIRVTGQALIRFDVRSVSQTTRQKFRQLREELNDNNPSVVLSDLEVAINGTDAVLTTQPSNNNEGAVHISPPSVLDALSDYGFNVFSTANNHLNDYGIPGQISTINELNRRKLPHSGNGFNLPQARAPAFVQDHGRTVAVLSSVSAPTLNTYGGIATNIYPGVSAVQLNTTTAALDPFALAAVLSDVQSAAARTKFVVTSHHNHFGNANDSVIDPWWSNYAHSSIDNGATMYVGHGPTTLRTIEIYKNKPIFYGLGSFLFQTSKGPGAYPNIRSFQSVIADICVNANSGNVTTVRLLPIVLNDDGEGTAETPNNSYDQWHATLGVPKLANLSEANDILSNIQDISPNLPLIINNGVGWINISPPQ